jgi:hypothetical protein
MRDARTADAPAADDADRDEDAFETDDGFEPDGSDDTVPCSGLMGCGLGTPCDGCCVGGLCIPTGSLCGEGIGRCLGPSCGGAGGLGERCATGQAPEGLIDEPGFVADADEPVCEYYPFTGCTDINAVCETGVCVHCGLPGEPCCQNLCVGQAYCNASGRCDSVCGAAGQPCCIDNGALYDCDDGGACLDFPGDDGGPTCVAGVPCHADGGSCTPCGDVGQPCCGDGGCSPYTGGCENGMCTFPPGKK